MFKKAGIVLLLIYIVVATSSNIDNFGDYMQCATNDLCYPNFMACTKDDICNRMMFPSDCYAICGIDMD